MLTQLRAALITLAWLTAITGVGYPLLVTGIARAAFPGQASGSLVERGGHVVGSSLLGQPFTSPGYFWGRGSATSPFPYNAGSSSASNLGPSNPALVDAVKARVAALRAADPSLAGELPVDLVTASGSGLDPDVSPGAAYAQVGRVAQARHLEAARVRKLVDGAVVGPTLGLFGEPRVNVLTLNLALDTLK